MTRFVALNIAPGPRDRKVEAVGEAGNAVSARDQLALDTLATKASLSRWTREAGTL